jgi:hypothetical protein
MEIEEGNIGHLYEFLTKFNVFIYAVNPSANLRNGPSMFTVECMKTFEFFRFFRFCPRLTTALSSRGPGVTFNPTKEKALAAFPASQRFPV